MMKYILILLLVNPFASAENPTTDSIEESAPTAAELMASMDGNL